MILGNISAEIDSYRLKYAGTRDYLLYYVWNTINEKYSLIRSNEGVLIRRKDDPAQPVKIGQEELTFREAIKDLIQNLIVK